MSYVMNDKELNHHGIKGMKWGVRRFQTKDGSLTPAGKKRYVTTAQGVRNANAAAKAARKASLAESRVTDSGIGSYRRAMNKASAAANEARRNSIAKDKAYNKQLREEKNAATKSAIKDYNKSFDDWNKSQELADTKWNAVNEQYKSLGKNRVTRIFNAARNKTDAAKAYNKSYNSWERSQNIADKKWTEVSEKYKKTGRNRVERILNNVRYG